LVVDADPASDSIGTILLTVTDLLLDAYSLTVTATTQYEGVSATSRASNSVTAET
jgi:hypothetical protein